MYDYMGSKFGHQGLGKEILRLGMDLSHLR